MTSSNIDNAIEILITINEDDTDPSEGSSNINEQLPTSTTRNKSSEFANEEVRRRRQKCLVVLSIFPFLIACSALGLYMMTHPQPNEQQQYGKQEPMLSSENNDSSGGISYSTTTSTSFAAANAAAAVQTPSTDSSMSFPGSTLTSTQPMPSSVGDITPNTTTSTTFATTSTVPSSSTDASTSLPGTTSTIAASHSSPGSINSEEDLMTSSDNIGTALSSTSSVWQSSENNLIELVNVGNDGIPVDVFPLGQCQGDCDNDDDCEVC